MHPGILIANIGHFKKILVQAAGFDGLHKNRLVGFGRTGGHNNPVELVFFDDLLHPILGILAAGEQILSCVNNIRKGFGIFFHVLDVDDSGDVDTAIADKDADPWLLIRQINLSGDFHTFGKGIAGRVQKTSGQAGCCAGLSDGTWNIFGLLKYAAGIHTRPGGCHRCKGLGDGKVVVVQLHFKALGQFSG